MSPVITDCLVLPGVVWLVVTEPTSRQKRMRRTRFKRSLYKKNRRLRSQCLLLHQANRHASDAPPSNRWGNATDITAFFKETHGMRHRRSLLRVHPRLVRHRPVRTRHCSCTISVEYLGAGRTVN